MKKSQSKTNWLKRQNQDIFVKLSKINGYRSRAAYKLLDINKKFKILKKGIKVIDLGASPGGWTQVVCEKVKNPKYEIVAIDKLYMEPINGCYFILEDIESILKKENQLERNSYDLVLSDMAPNASGHRFTDQARSEKICNLALDFAKKYLAPEGNFVCKVMRNSEDKKFFNKVKKLFKFIKIYKPASSRKDSKEIYVLAIGFNNLHKV